jgi:hypothetical protein
VGLRTVLDLPVPIATVLEFRKLSIARDATEIDHILSQLVRHLCERLQIIDRWKQRPLFNGAARNLTPNGKVRLSGQTVQTLRELVNQGKKFATIYADPPWRYDSEASRAAASNHYPTMSVDDICHEPVSELAEEDAHLHLWTTNGFLRGAFDVIDG